jgi:hypothetical protein
MQKNKLFIGGLAWATTEASLRAACEQYGEIEEVRVIVDRETGRSKGFGFVTFTSDESAARAKAEMDGQILDGRAVKVDFPREREDRGGGGGGGGRGGFGGGGGYGGGGGGGGYGGGGGSGGGGGYDRGPRRF